MAAGVIGVALVITACVAFPPNLAALAVGVAIGSTLAAGKVSTLVTDEVDKSIQKAEKTLTQEIKKSMKPMNSDEKQKIRDKLIETTQHAGPDAYNASKVLAKIATNKSFDDADKQKTLDTILQSALNDNEYSKDQLANIATNKSFDDADKQKTLDTILQSALNDNEYSKDQLANIATNKSFDDADRKRAFDSFKIRINR